MTTTKKTVAEKIAELEATPRALVGCDEGTHGAPESHRIYEEITGERYATYSLAGANATRCAEEEARRDTKGRIIDFTKATSEIRAKQRELAALKRLARQS